MKLEEMLGKYMRLRDELAQARAAHGWNTDHLNRLGADIASTEQALGKLISLYTVASVLRNRGASRLTVAAGNVGMEPGETSRGVDLGTATGFE